MVDPNIVFFHVFLLCLCSILSAVQPLTITTIPEINEELTQAYVPVESSALPVTIQCTVYNGNNQFNTLWFIQRSSDSSLISITLTNGVIINPHDLSDDVIITGEPITDHVSFGTNFTILNFTTQFDGAEVQCGTYSTRRKFKLGFAAIPLISNNTIINNIQYYYITEGHNGSVTMSKTNDHSFPPVISSEWLYNGIILNNSDCNDDGVGGIDTVSDSNNYTISFRNVTRKMSGLYTLVLRNAVGSSNKTFYLDVQFEPEVAPVSVTSITVHLGGIAVLQSFLSNIQGNPIPVVTWIGPDELLKTNSFRYNVSVPGTIIISNVTTQDNGTYACFIYNGIGNNHSQSTNLLITAPASAPQNISWTNVTNTSCQLCFDPPVFPGIPHFSYYHVLLTQSLSAIREVIAVSLSSNTCTVSLMNLTPYTNYSIIVTTVSYDDMNSWLEGEYSTEVKFQTLQGVPMILNMSASTVNGSISLYWIIQPRCDSANMTIMCYKGTDDNLLQQQYSNAGTNLSTGLAKMMSGGIAIGPVEATKKYSCIMMVINEIGTKTEMVMNIESNYGLPSTPCVVKSVLFPENVSVTVKIDHPGSDTVHLLVEMIYEDIPKQTQSKSYWYYDYHDAMSYKQVIFDIVTTKESNSSCYLVIKSMNKYGFSKDNVTIEIGGYDEHALSNMNKSMLMKAEVSLLPAMETLVVPSVISFMIMLMVMALIVILIIKYYRRKVYNMLNNQDSVYETAMNRPSPSSGQTTLTANSQQEDDIDTKGNMAYSEVHLYAMPNDCLTNM